MATNETVTTVTPEMTVQQLMDAGVVTLAQLQGFANRKAAGATRGAASPDRAAFAEEVWSIVLEQPTAQWKNGKVLKQWYPDGKQADPEAEKGRVKRHQQISRALADLVSDGRLVKARKGESASGTFYTVVADRIPAPADEADDSGDEA